MPTMKFHYFERQEDGPNPAGVTVSKSDELPDGDFEITEYVWGVTSLWFINDDHFSADERQGCFQAIEKGLVRDAD